MSKPLHVLVVDDDPGMVKSLVDILAVRGCEAEAAYSGPEAIEKVRAKRPDCVVTDIKMAGMSGVELCQALKRLYPDLPVVLMTAYADPKLMEQGRGAGAVAAMGKPLHLDRLFGFLYALRKRPSVVIVDDDPLFLKTLSDILREQEWAVTALPDPKGLADSIEDDGQVVVLDMKLNGGISGLQVLKEIRNSHKMAPVILVTGYGKEMAAEIEMAMQHDAYGCLRKPFQVNELLRLLGQIREAELSKVFQ